MERIGRPDQSGESISRPASEYEATSFDTLSIDDKIAALHCMEASFCRARQPVWDRRIAPHVCCADCKWFEHRGLFICCETQFGHLCTERACHEKQLHSGVFICELTGKIHGSDFQGEYFESRSYDAQSSTKLCPLEVTAGLRHTKKTLTAARVQSVVDAPFTAHELHCLARGIPLPSRLLLLEEAKSEENQAPREQHTAIKRQLAMHENETLWAMGKLIHSIWPQAPPDIKDEVYLQWQRVMSTAAWQSTTGLYTYRQHVVACIYTMQQGSIKCDDTVVMPSDALDLERVDFSMLPQLIDLKTLPSLAKSARGIALYNESRSSIGQLNCFLCEWFKQAPPTLQSSPPAARFALIALGRKRDSPDPDETVISPKRHRPG